MTALVDARVHLGKAQEFLQAAEMNLDLELLNAATSDAVIAGINSKACDLPDIDWPHQQGRQPRRGRA